MSTRLSRRQQQIVGCKNPYMQHHQMSVWGNRGVYCIKGITVKEVNAARKLARGRFWWEKIVSSYVAISPKGKKQLFEVGDPMTKRLMRFEAVRWAKTGK